MRQRRRRRSYGGAVDQAAPPPDAAIVLDDTAIAEIAAQLQRVWPSPTGTRVCAHARRTGLAGGIPEAAGSRDAGVGWWRAEPPNPRAERPRGRA